MAVVHCWVGAVTSTTAWVRGKVSGASVRVAYSTHPALAWPSYTTAAAPTNDIASHSLTGLTPETQYYFALEVDGVLDTDFSGKFRTHATAGTPWSFTFAASSCAGNSTVDEDGDDGLAYIVSRMSNRPIFDTIREDDPDFFVHLGDMHYEDITSGVTATHRTAYDDLLTFNGTLTHEARQGRLYRNVPLVYIWDDHDYSGNDSDGTYAGKAVAASVFRERVPHYTLAESSAIYHEFTVGRVQFICTDSRYYRNFAGGTMLGSAQMTWLQGVLENSTAEFLIFCTQMQWHAGSSTQSWPGYPDERDDIVTLLSDNGWLDRMIMLTGDGHELGLDTGASNAYGGFPVHQLSALDSGSGVSGSDYDLIHRGGRDQWGRITVDDNGTRIAVKVEGLLRDEVLAEHTVEVLTDVTAPTTPTGLTVVDETPSSVSLTWNASTDEIAVAGYQVLRDGAEAGITFETEFTDLDLSPSTAYTYTVKALDNAFNLSAASSSAVGTTTALGTEAEPMAWPDTILGSLVEMKIDGTWEDITSDVYGSSRGKIEITRGSSNESGAALEPGVCSFTLKNEAGKYSPRNPNSVYYGLIGRNTPVRVWVPGPTAHLNIPWETTTGRGRVATTTSMDLTNDLDVRVELALDSVPVQDPTTFEVVEQSIIGRWDAADQNWALVTDYVGRLKLYWTPDGSNLLSATATSQVQFSAGQRHAIRVTLDVNNGASGNTATFYTSDSISGTWTQLGDTVVQAGTTSIQNDTADLMIGAVENTGGAAGSGRYYAVQVLNGIGGTAVVDADFTALSDGAAGLTDDAGRTWLFENGATLTHQHQRFYGEVANWPLEWETGGFDVWSTIEAYGVSRRLGQGAKPIRSALRRSIENTIPTPVAYWPLEDGINSDTGGPGLDGIINLATSGFDFASTTDQLGSKPVAQLTERSQMNGTTFNAEQGDWHFEFIYRLETLPTTERLFARFRMSGGTLSRVDVHIKTGQIRQRGYDDEGNLLYTSTVTDATGVGFFTGEWCRFRLFSVNNYPTAADVTVVMAWETCLQGFYWSGWNNYTATSPGAPAGISGTWSDDVFNGMGIGHVAVWDNLTGPTGGSGDGYVPRSFEGADHGHSGEFVVIRLGRLAEESDVRLATGWHGEDNETTKMGPQTPDSFLGNIQAVADSDMGRLFELRHAPSLYYRPRFQLYNQPTTMELDYTQTGQIEMPFAPIDDDAMIRNDVTVEREGGSSARSIATTGPLSTQDPPDGVGVYDESVTISLYNEDMPKQFADWRIHLGTWDEARFPTISMNLRTATEKTEEWLNFEIGDIFSVTNLPEWMPQDDLLLRMEGYTETINAFEWLVEMNCTPARPYRVGVVGEETLGHLDTAGCELAEDLDTTETAVDVTTTDGPIWTTESANMPFNIRVGGEVMTVTAISGSTAAQTMTVTRSVNGVIKAHSTGADVRLDEPARVVLG